MSTIPLRPSAFIARRSSRNKTRQIFAVTLTQCLRRYATCNADTSPQSRRSLDSLSFDRIERYNRPRSRREKIRYTPYKQLEDGLRDDPPIAVFPDPMIIAPSMGNIRIEQDDVQYIGSYNWVDSHKPTIIVPGAPRRYRDDALPYSVPLHRGGTFIDENGHRMRDRALLPLFAAVEETAAIRGAAPFDWPSVDVVTDRGNLRRLFSFLRGDRKHTQIRVDVQLADAKTLLFTRWERKTEQHCWVDPCFAHTFEAATTDPVPGCERGLSHHRVIAYDFDGLRMVLRCEIDAFLDHQTCASWDTHFLSGTEEVLLDNVDATSTMPRSYPSLRIMRGGKFVPQEYLIELKTTGGRAINWTRIFPQLYFSQTGNLIIANHRGGSFYKTRIEYLTTGGARARFALQEEHYRRLGPLLRAVREVVVARGPGARLSLIGVRGRGLEIRERKRTRGCLPEDVLQRFETRT